MSQARDASPPPSAPAAPPQQPQLASSAPSPSPQTQSSQQQQQQQPASVQMADMLKAHKQRIAQMKEENERRLKVATQSAVQASAALVESSNADVMEVFNTESQIEQQLKEVQAQTERFHKRMKDWATLYVKFNRCLKEVGDVHHWAQMVERDMVETVEILDRVTAKKRAALGIE